eukprot:NODE_14228_length_234_cov_1.586592.p1 GENE.NODE_14228_length_234_cov_1.586592~~NODE_14228_length_234_cov_1.586592.p1  ORF type:complete len:57 (-),score=5.27 NODE_14228_length_234_cov_1.586592:2-172(-)
MHAVLRRSALHAAPDSHQGAQAPQSFHAAVGTAILFCPLDVSHAWHRNLAHAEMPS